MLQAKEMSIPVSQIMWKWRHSKKQPSTVMSNEDQTILNNANVNLSYCEFAAVWYLNQTLIKLLENEIILSTIHTKVCIKLVSIDHKLILPLRSLIIR